MPVSVRKFTRRVKSIGLAAKSGIYKKLMTEKDSIKTILEILQSIEGKLHNSTWTQGGHVKINFEVFKLLHSPLVKALKWFGWSGLSAFSGAPGCGKYHFGKLCLPALERRWKNAFARAYPMPAVGTLVMVWDKAAGKWSPNWKVRDVKVKFHKETKGRDAGRDLYPEKRTVVVRKEGEKEKEVLFENIMLMDPKTLKKQKGQAIPRQSIRKYSDSPETGWKFKEGRDWKPTDFWFKMLWKSLVDIGDYAAPQAHEAHAQKKAVEAALREGALQKRRAPIADGGSLRGAPVGQKNAKMPLFLDLARICVEKAAELAFTWDYKACIAAIADRAAARGEVNAHGLGRLCWLSGWKRLESISAYIRMAAANLLAYAGYLQQLIDINIINKKAGTPGLGMTGGRLDWKTPGFKWMCNTKKRKPKSSPRQLSSLYKECLSDLQKIWRSDGWLEWFDKYLKKRNGQMGAKINQALNNGKFITGNWKGGDAWGAGGATAGIPLPLPPCTEGMYASKDKAPKWCRWRGGRRKVTRRRARRHAKTRKKHKRRHKRNTRRHRRRHRVRRRL